jgi:hypothetical protein
LVPPFIFYKFFDISFGQSLTFSEKLKKYPLVPDISKGGGQVVVDTDQDLKNHIKFKKLSHKTDEFLTSLRNFKNFSKLTHPKGHWG